MKEQELYRTLAKYYDFIYIDSAAKQTRLDLAHQYDISTINAKKDILMGIGYIQSLLAQGRLYIDESCEQTIAMFNNYAWDDREGLINERPDPKNIFRHIADAIRYALYTHSPNLEPIGDFMV